MLKNNNDPTDILLSSNTIDEDSNTGTLVGTLSMVDPDGDSGETYSLITGAGDDDNASFHIAGNELRTVTTFHYNTQSSYHIRIEVNDGYGGTFQKPFTISVTKINNDPTDIILTLDGVIYDGTTSGVLVGELSMIDPDGDAGGTFTLLTGADAIGSDNTKFSTYLSGLSGITP